MLERMDDFFTARVEGYDEHMRQYVEEDSEFYAFTASILPTMENVKVLDLGCGTGLELEEYFKANPTAMVTGIDMTEAMLDALKAKFPDKEINTICGSYFDVPFGEEVFDAAVSVESLHHFSEEEKLPLYTKLFKALKPGSSFILTDFFADLPEQEDYFRRELIRLRKEQDLPDDVFFHYDTPMTVEHEKEILLKAGFLSVDELGSWGSTHTLKAVKGYMLFENAYFIIGTSYAGKSTMVKELAKKHDGIACEENYHDNYPGELDPKEFPCLTYTRDLEDWHDFIRRSPKEYKAWIDGVRKECEILELRMLPKICDSGKKVFVDTNIGIETLKEIAPQDHVLVMLSDPKISIHRFFDRPDPEKQFLYRLILEEENPEAAMENYRQGLELICSQEAYDELENSGFNVIYRDESRTVEETVSLAEKAMGLK